MRTSFIEMAKAPASSSDRGEHLGRPHGSFRSMAPRRRRTATRPGGMISIFEDQSTADRQTVDQQKEKPAMPSECTQSLMSGRATLRRPSLSKPYISNHSITQETAQENKTVLKKEPRRRTIWVPSDDTTVMTIHPGNHGDQTTTSSIFPGPIPESNDTATLYAHKTKPRRAGRRSSLAQAPRRGAPLQPTLRPLQENIEISTEHKGANTGKENVPPGQLDTADFDGLKKVKASQILAKRRASMLPPLAVDSVNVVSRKRDLESPKELSSGRKPSLISASAQASAPRRISTSHAYEETRRLLVTTAREAPVKPYKPRVSIATSVSATQKYPIITENIRQPRMFEDSWLSYQETAVTELINRVFSNLSSRSPKFNIESLRGRLLELYQTRPMLLLFQRLQASLQFGALSLPKERENGSDATRFVNDIGLRQRFVHLWTKSYDDKVLRAAVEAVVGRQITLEEDRPLLTSDLEGFIATCLLRNEDSNTSVQKGTGSLSGSWNWRRTMQRGLMLIKLLDEAKWNSMIQGNLFKNTSSHKSSSSVLTDFVSIMLPWGGENARALSHLDYQLNHFQYALCEFDYHITNLAIDLRDGIRLTRLVELLIYPEDSHSQATDDQTISMPTGEVLDTSKPEHAFGPLSQHLKYPCTSHASKAYNNQIALSALLSVRSIAEVAAKTTTNDIVDGHRENTIALLWSLVRHWGLNSLIDWNDVRSELMRLSPGTVHETLLNKNLSSPSQRTQHRLLRDWATVVASKHQIPVPNLSTAFADGAIFECIVDEYQQYLAPSLSIDHAPSGLEVKLKALGCSTAFASIFAHSSAQGRFFDEDFTNATLAFLSSRLLRPSKGEREKRAVLKRLATDCAIVVQTREKVLSATITLQRAWRRHWNWRLDRLDKGDVDIWLFEGPKGA